jgi:WbqC-like protein family
VAPTAEGTSAPHGRCCVALVQSNYVPWKGYFDLIASADVFVLYDDAQFTTRDWRNRNRIKTPQGLAWLTVPVGDSRSRTIRDVRLPDPAWQRAHWRTLELAYKRAPHFSRVTEWLAPIYLDRNFTSLSELNKHLIDTICDQLDIRTNITESCSFRLEGARSQLILSICRQIGATEYLSGPSAKTYLDVNLFESNGISVRWIDYSRYPAYPQLWGDFIHEVSILDLLFNCGPDASSFMKFSANTAGRDCGTVMTASRAL